MSDEPRPLPILWGEPLPIGVVERLTGISQSKLRSWERRYGFPRTRRTLSGRRLFPFEQIEQLRLIAELVEHGHRPSTVVGMPLRDLVALHERATRFDNSEPPAGLTDAETAEVIAEWLEYIRRFDGVAFEDAFLSEWGRLGTVTFVMRRVAPFLVAVGEAWAVGSIGVAHEHYASERVHHELVNLWKPLSNWNRGPTLVLTTLPDESHTLGLHMIACIAAECGYRLAFLGAATPLDQIASSVTEVQATGVLLSASAHADPHAVTRQVETLCTLLSPTTRIVAGGAGAPARCPGVTIIRDLSRAYRWLKEGMPQSLV